MAKELVKAYEPQKYEDEIYKRWEESGFFNPDVCVAKGVCNQDAEPFSIVLPPPNVTGTLHMGHAAMLAIEDVMVRYRRMRGDRTLWLPGTDHAAIATQTKVEKLLMAKGMPDPRQELGREKFLKEVDKFAQESHDTIVNQTKKMGSSLDWSREAFTLDEPRNLAVRTVFKKMYDDGLIYRGYRIVNWCSRCHSTLADDEVEHKEQIAKLYTFKYAKDFPIAIATTRPETKLGDTAVAVNPKDKRYKKYIRQEIEVKNFAGGSDLRIKIIGDQTVDMKFGTGAVGVTPAHSLADYDMYQKHHLVLIKVIDEDGKMTDQVGQAYSGLEVLMARTKVIEYLRKNDLLIKEEETPNNLSICYRCGATIEPLPSQQWFIDVNKEFKVKESKLKSIKTGHSVTLKKLMQTVIKSGQIEIIPDRFSKTYFSWIDNLRDWCISRQIWYGHRIPVWYKGDEIYVGVDEPAGVGWQQDQDTLDTWFSSGLWTFSTLGWPNKTTDLKNYHPTSVMETGYDILFFWVARMILMTTYVLGDIPFKKVYLHGLVRDEQGRKMSKSLGNVIDPLDMIAKYGADATRLSLLLGNTPGNDTKLSEEKIAGFRNFANKLWNICRFMLININELKDNIDQPETKTDTDRAILHRLNNLIVSTSANLEKFNFSQAGESLRGFTWNELADWYLEKAKIEGGKSELLNYILNIILKLWHPFVPFVTEAIWQEIYGRSNLLMVQIWPDKFGDEDLYVKEWRNIQLVDEIITQIRVARAENDIEPTKRIKVVISAGNKKNLLEQHSQVITRLGTNIDELTIKTSLANPGGWQPIECGGGVEVFIDLSGAIDKDRLAKDFDQTEKYVSGLKKKLANKEFTKNAPEEIVAKEQQKLNEAKEKLTKLQKQLENIK